MFQAKPSPVKAEQDEQEEAKPAKETTVFVLKQDSDSEAQPEPVVSSEEVKADLTTSVEDVQEEPEVKQEVKEEEPKPKTTRDRPKGFVSNHKFSLHYQICGCLLGISFNLFLT